MLKRWIAVCAAMLMIFTTVAQAVTPAQEAQSSAERAAASLREGTMAGFVPLALSLWGGDAPMSVFDTIEAVTARDTLPYTDLARTILNVAALGYDPRSVYGRDLWQELWLTPHDNVTIAGAAFSILALTSVPLEPPRDRAFALDDLYALLLREQNDDGGFPVYLGDVSDVNATGWVITALATRGAVVDRDAIERATGYIEAQAQGDDSFLFEGIDSSESLAAVVVAYSVTDNFKAAHYMQRLLAYRNDDGGFCHSRGGTSDYIATSQAMLALYSVYTGQSPYDLRGLWSDTPFTRPQGTPSMIVVVLSILGALALIYLVLLAVSRYGRNRLARQEHSGEPPSTDGEEEQSE